MTTVHNAGRWALITGASSGLGVEFARLLAPAGMNLVLVARQREPMQALADELSARHGVKVHVLAMDLSEPGAPQSLKQQVDALGARVHTLVNNAGSGVHGRFVNAEPQRLSRMLQLNVASLSELSRLYAEDMARAGGGRILLVASLLGFMAAPEYAAYAASKAFVLHFGEALHDELAASGVHVTVLAPGLTDTGFTAAAGHRVSATLRLTLMKPRPVAEAGLNGLDANRALVVPGLFNKLSVFAARLTPRAMQRRIMEALLA